MVSHSQFQRLQNRTLYDKSDSANGKAGSSDKASRLLAIGQHSQRKCYDIRKSVRGDRKKLSPKVLESKSSDDGWRKQGQRRNTNTEAEVGEVVDPESGLEKSCFSISPVELSIPDKG